MASYAKCLCFFFLAFSLSSQTQARESTLFSKFSHKPTSQTNQQGSFSQKSAAPGPAPESKPVVEEHGYGLYGRESYRYSPTTADPVKTGRGSVGEGKFVSLDEIRERMRNGNGNGNGKREGEGKFVSLDEIREQMRNGNGNGKQGMSDTRFLENGKYYYDINQDVKDESRYKGNGYESEKMGMTEHVEDENSYPRNNGNGYVSEKQGMSDTRFLENGRYYYDINQDSKNMYTGDEFTSEQVENENTYPQNHGNGYGNGYETEKQGMSDIENRRYHYDIDENEDTYPENKMNGNGYVTEKQGMSDINEDIKNEDTYPKNKLNGNGYVTKKQGMSDTRFLENGKYHYDINAEVAKGGNGHSNEYNNGNERFENEEEMNRNYEEEMNQNYEEEMNNNNKNGNEGFANNKNEYENGYNENARYEGNNDHETQGRRGHKYNPNEYVTQGKEDNHGNTKKLPPNQYDSMKEYEKEEEYRLSHQYQSLP